VLAFLVTEWRLSDIELAEVARVSPPTVGRWRNSYGIRQPRPITISKELLVRLYVDRQLTMAEVGKRVGRSKDGVRTLLTRYSIPARPPGWIVGHRRPPNPATRRLPDDQTLQRAYDEGQTTQELAATYGVHQSTIYHRLKAAGTTFRRPGPRGPRQSPRQAPR